MKVLSIALRQVHSERGRTCRRGGPRRGQRQPSPIDRRSPCSRLPALRRGRSRDKLYATPRQPLRERGCNLPMRYILSPHDWRRAQYGQQPTPASRMRRPGRPVSARDGSPGPAHHRSGRTHRHKGDPIDRTPGELPGPHPAQPPSTRGPHRTLPIAAPNPPAPSFNPACMEHLMSRFEDSAFLFFDFSADARRSTI